MRLVPFFVSLVLTVGLVFVLNVQLPFGRSKTPRLGAFLSPQHGFWQNAEADSIQLNLNLKFPNLAGNVDVYFDERLVPHVFAEQENDAYFVQGYLHAKFRLWQMEFQTHAAAGRLSEIMGAQAGSSDFIANDRYFRRLGMVYAAENSVNEINADPDIKRILDAYTAGINSYISALTPNQFPVEYKLLDYKPEKWTNLKTALFLKLMSFDLAGYETDFEMTNAKNVFTLDDLEKIYPSIQDSVDPVIPRGTVFPKPGLQLINLSYHGSDYFGTRDSIAPSAYLKPDKDNGSNNWAVAGLKTASGRPILCNDPHLGLNLPSLWYEMQITTPASSSYGVSFPGAPSVIIGFNDSCSWGFTNASRDVRDYYEIKFADSTMKEYVFNGSVKQATIRKEVIKVRGQADIVEKIAMTEFGPVMYDRSYPNKLNDGKAYAVRWKAHDPSNELITFYKLNKAGNFRDFMDAISTYKTPGQNMLFASKRGTIAIKQQGEFPAKWIKQGDFVMPGDDPMYAWQGMIPQDENPMLVNPPRGFVSSANQIPADNNYPYYLGGSFPPYRGFIINRQLASMNNITAQDMQGLQTDNYNVFAEMARPLLLKYIDEEQLTADQTKYMDILRSWNLQNDIQETAPTIFKLWWDSLEVAVWKDEFLQTKLPLKWPDESTLLEGLLKDSTYKFLDDIETSDTIETVHDAVQKAFLMAYKEIKKSESTNSLPWGKFKDTGVRHLLRLPALSRLHLPIGGGENIINATKANWGPSWRMVVHMTDVIEAYGVYPGGQSGNPGSRYYDNFIDTWAEGKYHTLLFVKKEDALKGGKMKWIMKFSKG